MAAAAAGIGDNFAHLSAHGRLQSALSNPIAALSVSPGEQQTAVLAAAQMMMSSVVDPIPEVD